MLEVGSVTAEVVRAAREALDVLQVILFGSRVDGSATDDSDHDFLIVARSDLLGLPCHRRSEAPSFCTGSRRCTKVLRLRPLGSPLRMRPSPAPLVLAKD